MEIKSVNTMPLSVGTGFGTYKIISPIGAGGMGEVYRARDTRLKRDVALRFAGRIRARDAWLASATAGRDTTGIPEKRDLQRSRRRRPVTLADNVSGCPGRRTAGSSSRTVKERSAARPVA
jgi:serine/threonine protein kinase